MSLQQEFTALSERKLRTLAWVPGHCSAKDNRLADETGKDRSFKSKGIRLLMSRPCCS